MKLLEIFRFELTYQVRRLSTWLWFAVLFAFTVLMMVGSRPSEGDEYLNSPFAIAFFTVLGGAIWLLTASSVAGEAAARDVESRMHFLTYTTPVRKAEYLGGRFFAAFVLNALILLAVPAGILIAISLPGAEAARLGPFRPAAYLSAYGIIALPFAFLATALQFSSAMLNRRPVASYLASVLLLITTMFLSGSAAHPELAILLDPVGIVGVILPLGAEWTSAQKNTRLVGLESMLLANRLLWLTIAVGVLAFTYVRFRLAHPLGSTGRSLIRQGGAPRARRTGEVERTAPLTAPQVPSASGRAMNFRQALGIGWASFRWITGSPRAVALLVAGTALVVVIVLAHMETQGVPLLPRTDYLLTFLTAPLTSPNTPWVIVPLLIVFYAGELVWRERDAGLGDIADAAPVPAWAVFLGKFLGLALILAAWMALLMLAGLLVQASLGYYEFEITLNLSVLFGLQLTEYILFALLALVVQALVNQKYVGHLITLVAYAVIAFGSSLGIEHNLLIYGAAPQWSYSEMRGFGQSLGPWAWFKLYWAAWALLLAAAASLLWARGRETALGARLRLARRRFAGPMVAIVTAAVGLILTLGGFIFYNTNVLNEHRTASEVAALRAEYERRYAGYAGIPQPRLTRSDLNVEIYPGRREVEIRGTYNLVNSTAVTIDSIHVAIVPGVGVAALAFDRPATNVLADDDLGHRIYTLESPLQPGDSVRLSFEVHIQQRGFSNSGAGTAVAANGTHFRDEAWRPAIGYQAGRELLSPGERRAHGLPPRPVFLPLDQAAARQDSVSEQPIAFQVVIGTTPDQIAVAPGALLRTWADGGRRYFQYATDAPSWPIFSAGYTVREARWQNVAIRIYHHPGHSGNLDRMLQSIPASLTYYTAHFGAYPYDHMTLVQIPGYGGMHAHPSLITFQEGFSLLDPEGSQAPDLPFAVVAHEVAHQWWGSHLGPERVEGNSLISEGLAEYSALRVLEKARGRESLRRYLDQLRTQFAAQGASAGLPLLRANSSFHQYHKGPAAIYAVSEYIGEEQVNEALRRLLAQHGSGELVTTLDLYRHMQAVTPDSLQYLLYDLFAANTYWELRTETATAVQTGAGTWRVTLEVQARKVVVDTVGIKTAVPMDDWVEVGVFAEGEESGRPTYLQKHRIRSGTQRITVNVPSRPMRAGIDPRYLLIDLEMADNERQVEIER